MKKLMVILLAVAMLVLVACPVDVPIIYTVTFNWNIPGQTETVYTTVEVAEYTTATQPAAPTRAELGFAGWYTSADCTTSFVFASAITADVSVYAKWIDETRLDAASPANYFTIDYLFQRIIGDELSTFSGTGAGHYISKDYTHLASGDIIRIKYYYDISLPDFPGAYYEVLLVKKGTYYYDAVCNTTIGISYLMAYNAIYHATDPMMSREKTGNNSLIIDSLYNWGNIIYYMDGSANFLGVEGSTAKIQLDSEGFGLLYLSAFGPDALTVVTEDSVMSAGSYEHTATDVQ